MHKGIDEGAERVAGQVQTALWRGAGVARVIAADAQNEEDAL
jgi:hypothetical protein